MDKNHKGWVSFCHNVTLDCQSPNIIVEWFSDEYTLEGSLCRWFSLLVNHNEQVYTHSFMLAQQSIGKSPKSLIERFVQYCVQCCFFLFCCFYCVLLLLQLMFNVVCMCADLYYKPNEEIVHICICCY